MVGVVNLFMLWAPLSLWLFEKGRGLSAGPELLSIIISLSALHRHQLTGVKQPTTNQRSRGARMVQWLKGLTRNPTFAGLLFYDKSIIWLTPESID